MKAKIKASELLDPDCWNLVSSFLPKQFSGTLGRIARIDVHERIRLLAEEGRRKFQGITRALTHYLKGSLPNSQKPVQKLAIQMFRPGLDCIASRESLDEQGAHLFATLRNMIPSSQSVDSDPSRYIALLEPALEQYEALLRQIEADPLSTQEIKQIVGRVTEAIRLCLGVYQASTTDQLETLLREVGTLCHDLHQENLDLLAVHLSEASKRCSLPHHTQQTLTLMLYNYSSAAIQYLDAHRTSPHRGHIFAQLNQDGQLALTNPELRRVMNHAVKGCRLHDSDQGPEADRIRQRAAKLREVLHTPRADASAGAVGTFLAFLIPLIVCIISFATIGLLGPVGLGFCIVLALVLIFGVSISSKNYHTHHIAYLRHIELIRQLTAEW